MKRITLAVGVVTVVTTLLGASARPEAPATQAASDDHADRMERVGAFKSASHFEEGAAFVDSVLAITEAEQGRESLAYAELLENWVRLRSAAGHRRDPSTLVAARNAVSIREAIYGMDDANIAPSLQLLSRLLADLGETDEAQAVISRALTLQEAQLPPDDVAWGPTLSTQAVIFGYLGDGPQAEAFFLRAVAIYEKHLDRADRRLVVAWNNVGWALYIQGKHDEAQEVDLRVLAIREETLPPDDLDIAQSLNAVGLGYWRQGNVAKARACHEQALDIRRRSLGPDHELVSQSLNNLAICYRAQGNPLRAIPLYEQSLAIRSKALGSEHPEVALILHNMGNLYRDIGQPQTAMSYYERALEIRRAKIGERHYHTGWTLNAMAEAELPLGRLEDAQAHAELALDIWMEYFGPQIYLVAEPMANLADIAWAQEDRQQALDWSRRTLALREATMSEQHIQVAKSKLQLASMLAMTGDSDEALDLALSAEATGREYFRVVAQSLSEIEALNAAEDRPASLDQSLSLLAQADPEPDDTYRVWDAVVRSRALVLDEMARRHRAVLATDDPVLLALADSVQLARRELAELFVDGPRDDDDPGVYETAVAAASTRKEDAERQLASSSHRFESAAASSSIGLEDALAALKPREALVAYVRFSEAIDRGNYVPRYGAFVARADAAGEHDRLGDRSGILHSEFVPLPRASIVDQLVARWLEEMRRGDTTLGWKSKLTSYIELADEIRQQTWDPVVERIPSETQTVFIVPAGDLHLINWLTLPSNDGETFLAETELAMRIVSAERDLVRRDAVAEGVGMLAVGGVDYDHVDEGRLDVSVVLAAAEPSANTVYRGFRSACPNLEEIQFEELPATLEEVESIQSLWPESSEPGFFLLTGAVAEEGAVKRSVSGRRVVHLATHGFSLGACRIEDRSDSRIQMVQLLRESPLLSAGLALAGANRHENAPDEQEDGILTAEEVAALDLSSAEWVVLSACDTGLGDIRVGEGVVGLRRAFVIAGARTLVMSLWPVRDELARDWMTDLYRRRWIDGSPTGPAARGAMRTGLDQARRAGTSTHPAFWAPFFVVGVD